MKGGHAWPVAIILVLAITVAANLWVMRIAGSDPSFAVEPDYYRKAVAWDSAMAQEGRNRALDWQVRPEIHGFTSGRAATLDVRISGPDGEAIRDARVRVTAFAVARSANRIERDVPPSADGAAYRVVLPVARGGAWELRFDVRKGDAHFTATRRVEIAREGAPRGTGT